MIWLVCRPPPRKRAVLKVLKILGASFDLWLGSSFIVFFFWSLQEPTKSAKSSTKNSNAGGGKDAGTENSEEVKMTVLKTYLVLCLTAGLPCGLGTNTCLLSVVAGLFLSSGHKTAKIQFQSLFARQRSLCIVINEVITALPVDLLVFLQLRWYLFCIYIFYTCTLGLSNSQVWSVSCWGWLKLLISTLLPENLHFYFCFIK